RHRALLLEDIPHFLFAQRPQQSRYPSLIAPALELHRRPTKQPHVVLRKAALQQLLDRTGQQVSRAELFDAALRILPGFLEIGLVHVGWARDLLDQKPRAPLAVSSENETRGKLLRRSEVSLERIGEGTSVQRDDPLVTHGPLICLDRDGYTARAANKFAEPVGIG